VIIGLLVQIALIALVVFGIRAIRHRRTDAPLSHQLRNVFQYVLLLALLIASASGISGLLGMAIDRADFVAADSSELALNLSLVLVGTPLLVAIGFWTRKRIAVDPTETSSAGWTLFVTVAVIATLTVALFGAYAMVRFAFMATDFDGFALAQFVVWGAAWVLVDRLDLRFAADRRADFRHVVLALIGLGVSAVGIGRLVAALLERVTLPGSLNALLVDDTSPIANAAALLIIASPVWIRYWVRGLATAPGSDGWRLHVVLFGIAGGVITAIVAGATVLYSVAVWFLGSPRESEISDHFSSLPGALGAASAGLLVWAYHRAVLNSHRQPVRSEIDRTYLYVMAIGGLLAAAVGVVILFGAFIEALTGGALLAGDPAHNTLLLAVILLAIGIPVWWLHWRAAATHAEAGERDEVESLSRRVFLISLIGVGGLVALGTGIATVYLFLRDVLDGTLSSSTIRSLRIPLATLLTSGTISLYHLRCYRHDHASRETSSPRAVRRRVVLVGPFDQSVDQLVRADGSVDVRWIGTVVGTWSVDAVRQTLHEHPGDVVISLTPNGPFGAELSTS
jgi:hypothetical protein